MWAIKCADVADLFNTSEYYIGRNNISDNVRVEVASSIQNIIYSRVSKLPISESYVGELSKIKDILDGTH